MEVSGDAESSTPMVTALLGGRMLEMRAAYSRLTTRRDRLAFLRRHAVVGGAEAQVHGADQLHFDEPPALRQLRPSPESRPAPVMCIRGTDRREDDVAMLAAVLPAGTPLLSPLSPGAVDDDESSSFFSTSDVGPSDDNEYPSRTLDNWAGLSTSDSTAATRSASPPASSQPPSRLRQFFRK